jgi:type VI secretion system ImpA/VasJ family protein
MSMDIKEYDLKDFGNSPINQENASGLDLTHEMEFEWLENEINKLYNPILTNTEEDDNSSKSHFIYQPVDWERVAPDCIQILHLRSKDLRIAAWLMRALFETGGIGQLVKGLEAYYQLTSNFWNSIYPIRPRARQASIQKMRDLILEKFNGGSNKDIYQPLPPDMVHLEKLLEYIKEINGFVQDKLPDSFISFNQFIIIIEGKISKLRDNISQTNNVTPPKIDEKPIVPNSIPSIETDTKQIKEDIPVQTQPIIKPVQRTYNFLKPADRFDYFHSLQDTAVQFHQFMLESLPTEPISYKLIRTICWSPIQYASESQIPMPSPNGLQIDHLKKLEDSSDWQMLLLASEKIFPDFWYWLDLQRYSIISLKGLGSKYLLPQNAIFNELNFLLCKMPFFHKLQTQGGFPTASQETIEWLEGYDLFRSVSEKGVPSFNTGAVKESEYDIQGFSIDANVEIHENLDKLNEFIHLSENRRDAFVAQLKFVEYLIAKGETIMAYSFMDRLDNFIEKHRLHEWEPSLALQGLGLIYLCSLRMLENCKKDERSFYTNRARMILPRISAINPALAAEIMKKGK